MEHGVFLCLSPIHYQLEAISSPLTDCIRTYAYSIWNKTPANGKRINSQSVGPCPSSPTWFMEREHRTITFRFYFKRPLCERWKGISVVISAFDSQFDEFVYRDFYGIYGGIKRFNKIIVGVRVVCSFYKVQKRISSTFCC